MKKRTWLKILITVSALVMLAGLSACGGGSSTTTAGDSTSLSGSVQ